MADPELLAPEITLESEGIVIMASFLYELNISTNFNPNHYAAAGTAEYPLVSARSQLLQSVVSAHGVDIHWDNRIAMGGGSMIYAGTFGPTITQIMATDNSPYLIGVYPGKQLAAKVTDTQGIEIFIGSHEMEVRVMRDIHHPNVIGLRMAINQGQSQPVYNDQGNVHNYMDSETGRGAAFDTIFTDLMKGLQHLHSMGISHGDVSAGNAVVFTDTSRASGVLAKWIDFEMSQWLGKPVLDEDITDTDFHGLRRTDIQDFRSVINASALKMRNRYSSGNCEANLSLWDNVCAAMGNSNNDLTWILENYLMTI